MSAAARLLIALKSPIQSKVDDRPRCADCGAVLVTSDFHAYWDGQIPSRDALTPRACVDCAEAHS